MRRLLMILACFIVLRAEAAAPPPEHGPLSDGGPAVAFDGTQIVASGAVKGDVLYAAGLEVRGGNNILAIESHVATATAGADGVAHLDMEKRVTVRSIWVVVDGKGGYTVSPGPQMVRRQMSLPGNPAAPGNDGQVRKLALRKSSVFVFLVRPSVGMWSERMMDGHMNDDDKTINGSVSGSFGDLQPVAGTTAPAPDHLLPGDVLFVVDPYTLEFAVSRQGK